MTTVPLLMGYAYPAFETYDKPNLVGSNGSAHSVSGEPPEDDVIANLHQAIKDATGIDVSKPKRRIGFLP